MLVFTVHAGIYDPCWYLRFMLVFTIHAGIYDPCWYLRFMQLFTIHPGIYRGILVFTGAQLQGHQIALPHVQNLGKNPGYKDPTVHNNFGKTIWFHARKVNDGRGSRPAHAHGEAPGQEKRTPHGFCRFGKGVRQGPERPNLVGDEAQRCSRSIR